MFRYDQAVVSFWPTPYEAWSFRALVPVDEAGMQRGLQGLPELEPGTGMLFPSRLWPESEKIQMWLASVSFPLNMIWIGRDAHVAFIQKDVRPGDRRTFSHRGIAVLEVAASDPWARGIDKGMLVDFD